MNINPNILPVEVFESKKVVSADVTTPPLPLTCLNSEPPYAAIVSTERGFFEDEETEESKQPEATDSKPISD